MSEVVNDYAGQALPWGRDARWELVLAEGVLAIVLGLILAFFPEASATAVLRLLSFYLLATGVLTIHRTWQAPPSRALNFQIMRGTVGVTVGLITVIPPLIYDIAGDPVALSSLTFLIATGLGLQGLIGLWAAFSPGLAGARWTTALASLLVLLLSLVLFFELLSGANLTVALGLAAIPVGLLLILASLLRRRNMSGT